MNHETHGHDELKSRISSWLSGELEPAAARAVGREVDRDPAAGRIAAGYRRVDALARDWYDSLPVEADVQPPAAEFRPPQPARVRGPIMAAIAASLMVAAWIPAVSAQDVTRLMARVSSRFIAADEDASAPRFERSAYWTLRPLAADWALRPTGDGSEFPRR